MQTFLFVASNQIFFQTEIEKIKRRIKVSLFNIHEISPSPSITIGDVRGITKILSRKPYGGGDRLVIIQNIEKSTHEAGNALLKILEEPPSGTYIVLTTNNLNRLLPTIVSRCQVVSEREVAPTTDERKIHETHEVLKKIIAASCGERILLSQKLVKSKEEVICFLDLLLTVLSQLMHDPNNKLGLEPKELADSIKRIMAAKNYLDKNVNYKTTLDVLLLGLPRQ